MCARLAYPNGEAKDEVTATAMSGSRTAFDGNMEGTLAPFGVERKRYDSPVRKAKSD